MPITATITAISKYDEWKNFWKTGFDSHFRNKNLTTADIISISSQEIASDLGSNDESNHANELGISDAGSYLICDGFIRGDNMRYATVLTWLSPEQTHLDIRDLPILDTSGRRSAQEKLLFPPINSELMMAGAAGCRRSLST